MGAGQERVLEVPRLRLARLVLEEGATLRLAPGLQQFELHADEAWIGRDGADGAPGRAGVNGRFLVQPQARP